MRLFSIFLMSLISVSVHAANSMEANASFTELERENFAYDSEISEWDRLLQQAGSKKFKNTHPDFEYDCVFPDAPEYAAPGWVCDEPIEGFEIAAVGAGYGDAYKDAVEKVSDERGDYVNRVDAPIKAYLDAVVFVQSMINITVDNMVREYSNEDDVKIKEDAVSKQITSINSQSGKTQLKHMIKNYSEFNEAGVKTDSISTAVLKLSHGSEYCRVLIKTYVELNLEDDVDVADSTVSRGQCDFNQIVEDMDESGWKLLNMIKSPGEAYYVLVGYSEPIEDVIETSLENDRSLWEQFKAQQGDDLEEELKKELGSE